MDLLALEEVEAKVLLVLEELEAKVLLALEELGKVWVATRLGLDLMASPMNGVLETQTTASQETLKACRLLLHHSQSDLTDLLVNLEAASLCCKSNKGRTKLWPFTWLLFDPGTKNFNSPLIFHGY